MSNSFISAWADAQRPKAHHMDKDVSVFYRNLEEELDMRRNQHACIMLHTKGEVVDFSSTDILGLSASGAVRKGYLEELAKYPEFQLSSHGSRLTDGNSVHLEAVEKELAEFHGAESALIVNTGSLGNAAIFSCIPRSGDAIVYDELIHASAHDGIRESLALYQRSFRHNDVESLIEVLNQVKNTQPQIRDGSRSVLIAVESVYSMDGDVCPLRALIEAAKAVFPQGNAQFVIDEAHSTGVVGPDGRGLVCALHLEKQVAVRLHTFGKALAAAGAVILCNDIVRSMLINYSRSIMFSVAPSFPMLSSIRVTYNLLRSGATEQAQKRIPEIVRYFIGALTDSELWDQANDLGLLQLPPHYEDIFDNIEDGSQEQFVTQILPLRTPRKKHNYYLAFHLQLAGFSVFPISYPVVPKGTERVRIIFHASNTNEQVDALVASIFSWIREMLNIEETGSETELPAAAKHVYGLIENGGTAGK